MPEIWNPSSSRGQYASISNTEASSLPSSDISRVLPRQLSTGTMRGTQNVGYGGVKIDGSNNRITIGAPDGSSIGMGAIPGSTTNEFGFFALNTDGKVVMKIVNGTWYVNDLTTDKNIMQSGKLPNASYGWAVAKAGKNVADIFS